MRGRQWGGVGELPMIFELRRRLGESQAGAIGAELRRFLVKCTKAEGRGDLRNI